jgi:hypothetical protein
MTLIVSSDLHRTPPPPPRVKRVDPNSNWNKSNTDTSFSQKSGASSNASGAVPAWAESLVHKHWGEGGPVPHKSKTHRGLKFRYIAKPALAWPEQHPIMIRPAYVEVLRKLEENLDKENLDNVLEEVDDDQSESDDGESSPTAESPSGLNANTPTTADSETHSDAHTDRATAGTDMDETNNEASAAEFDIEIDDAEFDIEPDGAATDAEADDAETGTKADVVKTVTDIDLDPEGGIITDFVEENTRQGLCIFGHPGSGTHVVYIIRFC